MRGGWVLALGGALAQVEVWAALAPGVSVGRDGYNR